MYYELCMCILGYLCMSVIIIMSSYIGKPVVPEDVQSTTRVRVPQRSATVMFSHVHHTPLNVDQVPVDIPTLSEHLEEDERYVAHCIVITQCRRN